VRVAYGFSYDETVDRSFVVHDRAGKRVTCARIPGRH
jgi:hypothetical protein